MKVQDAFRAQYFFACLERIIQQTQQTLSDFTCIAVPLQTLLTDFSANLLIELDQLLLPTIVFEFHEAKQSRKLFGESSEARYASFFVNDQEYTRQAKDIILKYPFLFELLDSLITQTFDSLVLFFKRYWQDKEEIKKWLKLSPELLISEIQPLRNSDRHRKQQTLLITFSDGNKVIYKPVDLSPDLLFGEFVTCLELENPYNLRTLNTLSKDGYGWMEYICQDECDTFSEVKNFYCRAGVLLAVADALNYTDGHCENLIASGGFPILIDNETLFQNYESSIAQQKNILSTLLIQKVSEESSDYLNSAFQAPHGIKLEHFQTHAINDHTDEIQVRYFGINPSLHHHCPIFSNSSYSASDYLSNVIEGYSYAYDRISCKLTDILKNTEWWEKVDLVQSRIVIRETMSYMFLLRKMQQPENISRNYSEAILREKLGDTIYTNYEVSDLLALNVPYFYHLPGEKHLYDGNGYRYTDVFKETAVESMRRQFMARSEEKKLFDCEIVARHLMAASTSGVKY